MVEVGISAPRASRYDAFISYSHAHDSLIAEALQREIQRFGVSWYRQWLRTQVSQPSARSLHALRVFRDVTNLSASPALWPMIIDALEVSEWFILMASPAAARSDSVGREVRWWLTNRSVDRILIVWTDGELLWRGGDFDWAATDAVPQDFAGFFAEAPRWVDLPQYRPIAVTTSTTAVGHPGTPAEARAR